MPNLAERLIRMTVTVKSPDGNIGATSDSERRVRFHMRASALEDYTAQELARQLCAVLSALDEGRRRGVHKAYAEAGKRLADPDESSGGAAERRFRRELANLEVSGRSQRRLVRIERCGTSGAYRARIHPDVPSRLTAEQLTAEFDSAYRELRSDHLRKRFALVREHLPS